MIRRCSKYQYDLHLESFIFKSFVVCLLKLCLFNFHQKQNWNEYRSFLPHTRSKKNIFFFFLISFLFGIKLFIQLWFFCFFLVPFCFIAYRFFVLGSWCFYLPVIVCLLFDVSSPSSFYWRLASESNKIVKPSQFSRVFFCLLFIYFCFVLSCIHRKCFLSFSGWRNCGLVDFHSIFHRRCSSPKIWFSSPYWFSQS